MKLTGFSFGVFVLFTCSCKPWIVVNYPPLPTVDSLPINAQKHVEPVKSTPTVVYVQPSPSNPTSASTTVVHEVTKDAFRVLEIAFLKGTLDSSTFVQLYREVLSTAKDLISEEIELEEAREATILAEVKKLTLELKKLNHGLGKEETTESVEVDDEE